MLLSEQLFLLSRLLSLLGICLPELSEATLLASYAGRLLREQWLYRACKPPKNPFHDFGSSESACPVVFCGTGEPIFRSTLARRKWVAAACFSFLMLPLKILNADRTEERPVRPTHQRDQCPSFSLCSHKSFQAPQQPFYMTQQLL